MNQAFSRGQLALAVRRLERRPCPSHGRHLWLFFAANVCFEAGLDENTAEVLIRERLTRPEKPAGEILTTLNRVYSPDARRPAPPDSSRRSKPAVRAPSVEFDRGALARFIEDVPAVTKDWLRAVSAVPPARVSPLGFLRHFYDPGERIVILDRMKASIPLGLAEITAEGLRSWKPSRRDCRGFPFKPAEARSLDRLLVTNPFRDGVWFLVQPVDGRWHGEPGAESCRNAAAVTAWRFLVLESDTAPTPEWLRAIVRLPAVAAVYTSGGRSIHALVRVDMPSKDAFDARVARIRPHLTAIGADPGAMTAVRLSRLPGCRRVSKRGVQQLLYLAPDTTPNSPPIIERHRLTR